MLYSDEIIEICLDERTNAIWVSLILSSLEQHSAAMRTLQTGIGLNVFCDAAIVTAAICLGVNKLVLIGAYRR